MKHLAHFSQLSFVAAALSLLPAVGHTQSAAAGNPLNALPAVPLPPAQAQVPLQVTPPQNQLQETLSRTLLVTRVDVQGVSAIPFEDVANLLQPLSGQTRSLAELLAVAEKITALYQTRGYALSFAYLPPQDFAGGVVRVQVVEGFIQRLELEGDFGKSEALIREMAAPLLAEKPLTSATFQKQTQLMTRLPGITITANANLPTTTDGATPLILRAKHKPILVSVGGEMRKPATRFIASLLLNDPLWQGSQVQLSTLLKNPDQERFLSAGLTQMLNASGTSARVAYTDYRSRNDPLSHVEGIDDVTEQRKLDIGVTHPWVISSTEQLSTTVGMYGVNYRKGYLVQSSQLAISDAEKTRALYAQLAWARSQGTMAQSASVFFAQGLRAMGAGLARSNSAGAAMDTNPADLGFTRISVDYAQRHRFANKLGAAFAVGGQYSPDVLPASERTSFGGTRFGRGYAAGEFAGDSGFGASAELNYQWAMDTRWLKSVEPYVMFEYAKTTQQQAGMASSLLRSTTVGLRLADNKHYAVDLSASKPMGDRSFRNPDRKLRYGLLLTYNLDM